MAAVVFQNLRHFLVQLLALIIIIATLLEIRYTDARPLKAIQEIELGTTSVRKAIELKHDLEQIKTPMIPRHSRDEIAATKGNSPGVGHAFPGYAKESQLLHTQELNSRVQTQGFKEPEGHSPGVGHSYRTAGAIGPHA